MNRNNNVLKKNIIVALFSLISATVSPTQKKITQYTAYNTFKAPCIWDDKEKKESDDPEGVSCLYLMEQPVIKSTRGTIYDERVALGRQKIAIGTDVGSTITYYLKNSSTNINNVIYEDNIIEDIYSSGINQIKGVKFFYDKTAYQPIFTFLLCLKKLEKDWKLKIPKPILHFFIGEAMDTTNNIKSCGFVIGYNEENKPVLITKERELNGVASLGKIVTYTKVLPIDRKVASAHFTKDSKIYLLLENGCIDECNMSKNQIKSIIDNDKNKKSCSGNISFISIVYNSYNESEYIIYATDAKEIGDISLMGKNYNSFTKFKKKGNIIGFSSFKDNEKNNDNNKNNDGITVAIITPNKIYFAQKMSQSRVPLEFTQKFPVALDEGNAPSTFDDTGNFFSYSDSKKRHIVTLRRSCK